MNEKLPPLDEVMLSMLGRSVTERQAAEFNEAIERLDSGESPFQNYCEIHHRHESTKELYGSCLECGHVWRTQQEFLDDVAAIEHEMGVAPNWGHLLICPLCTHDL